MITTYTIDLKRLEENYCEFNKFGNVYYPVKTNHNKVILRKLKKLGCGFECDSISHIKKVYSRRTASKIIFSNVAKSYEDIEWAIRHKISFYTIDDINSLKTIISLAKKYRLKKININIRINIFDIFKSVFLNKSALDSCLGADINTCKELLDIINNQKEIEIYKGISFYVQTEMYNKKDMLEKVFEYLSINFSSEDKLSWINIGGGSSLTRLKDLASSIQNNMRLLKIKSLILEPGRFLLDNVVDVYIPIIRINNLNEGKVVASIAIGIYHGFIDIILHNREFDIGYIKDDKFIKLDKYSNEGKKLIIRGPTSDSLDLIGTFQMPSDLINKDTIFLVKNIGAYFQATESQFSTIIFTKTIVK